MDTAKEFNEIMTLVKQYGDEIERKHSSKGVAYFFIKPDVTFEKIAERLINALEQKTT